MLISRWIDRFTGQQRMVEDLTNRIAARCEPRVWARIRDLAPTMDPAQSRGYIRARASLVVQHEMQIAIQNMDDVTDSLVHRVARSVSEAIVRKMMAGIAVQHPSQLRRAA